MEFRLCIVICNLSLYLQPFREFFHHAQLLCNILLCECAQFIYLLNPLHCSIQVIFNSLYCSEHTFINKICPCIQVQLHFLSFGYIAIISLHQTGPPERLNQEKSFKLTINTVYCISTLCVYYISPCLQRYYGHRVYSHNQKSKLRFRDLNYSSKFTYLVNVEPGFTLSRCDYSIFFFHYVPISNLVPHKIQADQFLNLNIAGLVPLMSQESGLTSLCGIVCARV